MEEMRFNLNKESSETIKNLQEISNFLKLQKFDTGVEYFHFEVDPTITPVTAESIQSLLSLPFEISLTESNGKIIIETGTEHNAKGGPGFKERRDRSRLSMHTHPLSTDVPVNTPSFGDIFMTDNASKNTPLLLASPSGLMHYGKPVFDPVTNEIFDGEARDMMIKYAEHHGVDVTNSDFSGKFKNYKDLLPDERIQLERKFAEETGVIVYEALWEDVEGIKKLLAIVNLQQESEDKNTIDIDFLK